MRIVRVSFSAASLSGLVTVLGVAGLSPVHPAEAASATTPAKPAAAAAPAATTPAQPASTTATFDDWVLGCQRNQPSDKPNRLCEIGQIVRAQGRQDAVARVAIARLNKGDPLHFTALLPPNVSFPSSVHIALGDHDTAAVELPWHRCVSGFCQADGPLSDDAIKTWRGASDAGQLAFTDASGRTVTVPLSLKGLGPALDALAKELPQ